MKEIPLEIERKYLIRMPDRVLLDRLADRRDYIRQTYLLPDEPGTTERVRLRGCGEEAEYTHTVKRRITDLTREEREETVSPRAYRALLDRADPALRVIEKTRWCIPWNGLTLEVDCFPFWSDRAFLEIELPGAETDLGLPDWVQVVREVTEDPRYTNRALAEEIPLELLPGQGIEDLIRADPTRRTWAEIRLDRIGHNFKTMEAALPAGARCLGVVKADSYGHGDVEVSRRLEELGCAYMAVACLDEGAKLRAAGITAPILLLGPTPARWGDALASLDLTQALGSLEEARAYSAALTRPLKVHLKIDTGMSRTGFPWSRPEDLAAAMALPNLDCEGTFTHFAVSDERGGEEFTEEQHRRFTGCYAAAEAASGKAFRLHHCVNSGAMLTRRDLAHELVRPGLALYGMYPGEDTGGIPLLPAMNLKTRVAAITEHAPGDTVGYGRTFTLSRPTRLAVLPIGYADGLHRSLSNKLRVLIRGSLAPQLGRICMDLCMVDITDLPEVRVGDEVTIFGDGRPIEETAALAGTITYELCCAVSPRVPRVYLG